MMLLSRLSLPALSSLFPPAINNTMLFRRHTLLLVVLLTIPPMISSMEMPDIINHFEETRDLWNSLFQEWILPGTHFDASGTPPTNSWTVFVQKYGDAIITNA